MVSSKIGFIMKSHPVEASHFHTEKTNNVVDFKSFHDIQTHYNQEQCWGLLTSINVKNCNPDLIRSKEVIQNYVIALCELIDMKRFQDTIIVNFGEDEKVAGYSMVQLIETSLISGHFANLTNRAYIDIFSCKIYDPYQAAEFTKQFFGGDASTVNLCFRK